MASPFEWLRRLANAELKVNFVEGFAVHVSMASPFLSFYAYGVSMGYARFLLSRGAPRPYNVSVSMITPFLLRRNELRLYKRL